MKRTRRLALVALTVPLFGFGLGGGSALAAGGGCTGAPGASAIQQYCEAVPEASGKSQHAGDKSSSKSHVSSSTAAKLNAAGSDGAKVEALAGGAPAKTTSTTKHKTASKSSKKSKKSTAAAGGSGASGGSGGLGSGSGAVKGIKVNGPSDPSGSPLKAASHAVASGPTVGGGVVWGLVGLSALGVLGAVFLRRRPNNGSNPFDPPTDAS